MIIGIGLDIVEVERITNLSIRQERFPKRILTVNELKCYKHLSDSRKVEYLAGRFAAKEAYAKARGTGIGSHLSFLDIEIGTDENGKPRIVQPKFGRPHISITHTNQYAAAQVIIEG